MYARIATFEGVDAAAREQGAVQRLPAEDLVAQSISLRVIA
jgi:hypothetical protein